MLPGNSTLKAFAISRNFLEICHSHGNSFFSRPKRDSCIADAMIETYWSYFQA